MNIDSPKVILDSLPEDESECLRFFEEVSEFVLSLAFHPPDVTAAKDTVYNSEDDSCAGVEDEESPYCICREDKDGYWVLCENEHCPRGKWFHLECLNIMVEDLTDDDWYCSKACESAALIKKKTRQKIKIKGDTIDHVNEYAKALLWRGLGERVRHDAVKENDGERIMRHWRFDIGEFLYMHHPKYFIFAYKLITAVSGGASRRIAHQLTWNRTVNTQGGAGKNPEMDLHMEHLNQSIKSAAGQMTDMTIERHSEMVGLGREFQTLFYSSVCLRETSYRKHGKVNREDVIFVSFLLHLNFADVHEGRAFQGYPTFLLSTAMKNPLNFMKRINKHRKNVYRRMCIIARNS